jgi:anthraniloyl-CoA monooxygenase
MRIDILGGGAGGLYFAILMKKRNSAHDITVIERDGPNDTFGWGIVFSQRTIDLLQEADEATWREITNVARNWEHTATIHKDEIIPVRGNRFYGIRRLTLLQILHRRARDLGVDLHFHENITEPSQLEALATNADLLVGADGASSIVRRTYQDLFLPIVDLRQNKYVWLGTHQLFGGLTLMFRQTGAGLFIAHAYTFDGDTSTFIVECPPETWESSGLARMSDEETCSYLARVFKFELGGHDLLSNNFVRWANFPLIKNKRWSYRNMVLLGDAAHTVHFSIGSGTKLALEDSVALAKAFDSHQEVGTALSAYERAQKPRIDQFQEAAVRSLSWLEGVEQYLHLDPVPFAYALVTRSNRVGYNRLKRQAPEFIAQYDEWRHAQPSSGPVPREFLDLFRKVTFGHLATLMPDGRPQVTSVWVDYDGEYLLINSAKGRQKDLNMERHRDVAIEIPDPDNPNRYLAIRGSVVEITEEGADEHLDLLARRYLVRENYPPNWRFPGEVRRIYKIAPRHVTAWEPFG